MLAIVSTPAKPPPATTNVSNGFALFGGALCVGFFKMRDKAVAQLNRVAQRLHGERALCESWQFEEIRDRAQSENEMVVLERVRVMVEAVRYHNRALLQIDALHIARRKNPHDEASYARD